MRINLTTKKSQHTRNNGSKERGKKKDICSPWHEWKFPYLSKENIQTIIIYSLQFTIYSLQFTVYNLTQHPTPKT